ncbi:hypothetical protein D3C72_1606510 [compost metagenome]
MGQECSAILAAHLPTALANRACQPCATGAATLSFLHEIHEESRFASPGAACGGGHGCNGARPGGPARRQPREAGAGGGRRRDRHDPVQSRHARRRPRPDHRGRAQAVPALCRFPAHHAAGGRQRLAQRDAGAAEAALRAVRDAAGAQLRGIAGAAARAERQLPLPAVQDRQRRHRRGGADARDQQRRRDADRLPAAAHRRRLAHL